MVEDWNTSFFIDRCPVKTLQSCLPVRHISLYALVAALVLAGCGGAGDTPAEASTPQAVPVSSASATGQGPTGAGAQDTGTSGSNTTAGTDTSASGGASAPVVAEKTFQELVLEAVNGARAEPRTCGSVPYPAAPPVTWLAQAAQAAQTQVDYLQQNNLFSHTGANGSNVGDRLSATGYAWSVAGENLAAGYLDIATVMQGWLASPGHCANLMYGDFSEIGVVVIPGNSTNTYRTYWGMVLSRPR